MASSLCFSISCSKKNPLSSPSDGEGKIDSEKISFTVTHDDSIPTAFLNYMAKMAEQNKHGIVQAIITNNNKVPVQVRFSVKLDQYTDESVQTVSVGANGYTTVYSTPTISEDNLLKFNELKTVQCIVKATIINNDVENNGNVFHNTYPIQMLAKDVWVFGKNKEYAPLIALWVTPHAPKVEELISKAKNYAINQQFIGYQQSEAKDGFKNYTEGITKTVTVSAESFILGYEFTNPSLFTRNFTLSVNFSASGGSGNDIITLLTLNNAKILYNSGQIHQGNFSKQITEDGYYELLFDNRFSYFTSKTVLYTSQINYDLDLVLEQVCAIYSALQKDYNITYVSSTISFPQMNSQRVRFPNDALILGEANCIDGTVLFASALENIGIEPLIVLVPGHSYVGWKRGTNSNKYEFLETTMIGTSNFIDAYNEGNRKYSNDFNVQRDIIIDVAYWRKQGVTPIMKQLIP